ncbi:hypothetical protein C1645_738901 [Glomus cerebriforme]|uniref:Uncharacterized protein n=1 Tax=Glomus cerebriforme TaxID=658196 RepID=A0A397T1Q2_9GLOM|nr:hypothetical protein C1645_738901 [Glomus cerebriforme]
MYKDLNNEDVMHVENKLSELERQASETIHNIVSVSQTKDKIVLIRKDLEDLRKFLFIMNYRNGHRWSQFTSERFDSATRLEVKNFMKQYNLQRPEEVWLQNIREILDTPHSEVKDNQKIFSIDRYDYKHRMMECFLVIWQAGENDEFIITNNGFGIFEGITGIVVPFQFVYHSFYVISPKLVLVLCFGAFRQEVGTDRLYEHFGGKRSMFENVPHPAAITNYVGPVNTSCRESNNEEFNGNDIYDLHSHLFNKNLNSMGLKTQWNDTFTFPFVKINSATVNLVNFFLLNEVNPDLILTFLSRPYLYKTIVKYHKVKNVGVKHDFSNLKKNLFMALNRTHKDDLHLRKNIPAGHQTCNWNVRETNSGSKL